MPNHFEKHIEEYIVGAAEDSAKRQIAGLRDEEERARKQRVTGWIERMARSLPVALENLAQRGYPVQVPGSAMGRMIQWEGEERYAWPLMRADTFPDETYLLANGTFLRSPYGAEAFEEVSLEDAAHPAVALALERMAEFEGGPYRKPTFKRIFFSKD